jgi:hypothetical protein
VQDAKVRFDSAVDLSGRWLPGEGWAVSFDGVVRAVRYVDRYVAHLEDSSSSISSSSGVSNLFIDAWIPSSLISIECIHQGV